MHPDSGGPPLEEPGDEGRASAASVLRLVDSLPLAVYELDRAGRIVFTNRAYAEITGYTVDELMGKPVAELMAPGPDRDAMPEVFRQLVDDAPPPTPIVSENLTKDGRPQVVEVHWDYKRASDGRVSGFVCVLIDTTERERAERELRLSEARFRRMFEQAPWGSVVYAPDGRPLYVNPVQRRMMGLSEEELAPVISKYNILEDQQLVTLGLHEVIKRGFSGEPTSMPVVYYEPRKMDPPLDRDALWLRGFIYPVLDGMGEVREVVVTFEDVTAAKEVEGQRRELAMRIQQAQRMESLSVLAGGIAHDFNNLLVTILGNADLAWRDLPPESSVRSTVAAIMEGAKSAADLVKQLLVYAGAGAVSRDNLDLTTLVGDVAHLLETTVSKKATIEYSLAEGLPPVQADATELRQIVMNLIINASESLEDQAGVVSIRTGVGEYDAAYLARTYVDDGLPGGVYCHIEVADTGVGMDAETFGRLFEPFFTTKFVGRGLGLAAVLGIVRGHRGAIEVQSKVGEGTTVRILLPASSTPIGAEGPTDRPDEWRGRGTVLVVDDEETVRHVADRMLRVLGFDVVVAADGRAALDVVRADQSSLVCVILDLAMPEMDGWECFDELSELRPDLPVVVCTGYSERQALDRFSGKQPAAFVSKPFRLTHLTDALREVLG